MAAGLAARPLARVHEQKGAQGGATRRMPTDLARIHLLIKVGELQGIHVHVDG